jgi:hypothetical protein
MKFIYDKISLEYKRAMNKYTKGTGGGSGASQNFEVWEERDATQYFANYANHTTYLTLIHLADKVSGYRMYAKYEGLPGNCKLDGDCSISSGNASPKKGKTSEMIDSMLISTAKMQNTISQSTQQLIEAVTKPAQPMKRDRSQIMEDMRMANCLLDKATLSLQKKRKKMQRPFSSDTEIKEKLGDEIKSMKVHKTNVKALERELESMNERNDLEMSDINLSDLDSE